MGKTAFVALDILLGYLEIKQNVELNDIFRNKMIIKEKMLISMYIHAYYYFEVNSRTSIKRAKPRTGYEFKIYLLFCSS